MSDILKIHAVTEYYHCAFRPNDPELTVAEVLDFIEYMQMFYGSDVECPYPMFVTIAEICQGMIDRFKYRPSIDFDGDSVDRELVRDMIIDARERVKEAV
ncbi:hypothetical protein YFHUAIHA_CDS0118 [Phage C48C1]|nr:hypothetical protein YFHUAIHA_CDS0118 [Phage C48C1]